MLRHEDEKILHTYLGKWLTNHGCSPIIINGTSNHLHILFKIPANQTPADVVKELKRTSSKWLKSVDTHYDGFHWQGGYALFSVSESICNKVYQYIANQQLKHQELSTEKELEDFAHLHGITDYNEILYFLQ